MKKKILALIGEAGSGKDYLAHRISEERPDLFQNIVSCTSRPPRDYEINEREYWFLTEKEFTDKITNGEMLEYTNFRGWFYGTALNTLSDGKINIGVFNPAGIYILKDKFIDLKVFRLKATDKTRLIRQLNRESDPDVDEIVRRFFTDRADFENLKFDYKTLHNEIYEDIKPNIQEIVSFGQKWINNQE